MAVRVPGVESVREGVVSAKRHVSPRRATVLQAPVAAFAGSQLLTASDPGALNACFAR